MKGFLFCFFFVHLHCYGVAQSDCGFKFQYSGEIESLGIKIESIMLPTMQYYHGSSKGSKDLVFDKFSISNPKFKVSISSGVSSYYCIGYSQIIEKYFKSRNVIKVIVIEKRPTETVNQNQQEIEIPIEKINFRIVDNIVEILLPKLEI